MLVWTAGVGNGNAGTLWRTVHDPQPSYMQDDGAGRASSSRRVTTPLPDPPPSRLGPWLLRGVYVLICLVALVGVWIWAHDKPVAPVAVVEATPYPAGPLLGQELPTALPPTPPPVLSALQSPTAPSATPSPTVPLATPWPAATDLTPAAGDHTILVQDRNFSGGVIPRNGLYRDRSARTLFGGGDPISTTQTLTVPFNLNLATDSPTGTASLTLVGLTDSGSAALPLRITLNGTAISEGPTLFPTDDGAGVTRPGNWGGQRWPVPATAFQQGPNALVITNLDPVAAHFIALDYALLVWAR